MAGNAHNPIADDASSSSLQSLPLLVGEKAALLSSSVRSSSSSSSKEVDNGPHVIQLPVTTITSLSSSSFVSSDVATSSPSEKASSSTSYDSIPTPLSTFSEPPQQQRPGYGYAFMLASSICHALVTFLVHVSTTQYGFPAVGALMVRATTSFTLSSSYLLINFRSLSTTGSFNLTTRQLILLSVRGLFGGLTMLLSFSALARLPVGTAVTLFYASPAFTALASALILRPRDHPLTPGLCLTILGNFIGITLVSGPSFSTTSSSGSNTTWITGIICALGMALSSTTVFVLQRAMGLKVHFILGTFAHSIGCAINAALTASGNDVQQVWTNHGGLLFAVLSGLAGFGSQSFMNLGLQHAPAGPAIIVRSLSVPMTTVLGVVFLREVPGILGLLGMMIVFGSVMAIAAETVKGKKKREAEIADRAEERVATGSRV